MKNVNMINNKIKNLLSSSKQTYLEHIFYIIGLYLLLAIFGGICDHILFRSIISYLDQSIQFSDTGSALFYFIFMIFFGATPITITILQTVIFYISSQLFIIGISLGLIKILLLINKNRPTNTSMLFSAFDLIFKSINGSILFSMAIFFAFLPGFFIMLMSCNIDNLLMLIIGFIFQIIEFLGANYSNANFIDSIVDISSNYDVIYNYPLFILGFIVSIINIIWSILRLQFYQYFIVDDQVGSFKGLKRSFEITKNQTNLLLQSSLVIILINMLGFLFFKIGLIITIPFSALFMSKLYLSLKRGAL